jgi:phosphoserine phosphatase
VSGRRAGVAALVALLAFPTMTRALDELSWSPRNHEVLERLIAENGRGSKAWDPERPPCAVFDWDLTSAYMDCEEATLRYQLWNLRFKTSVDEWRALFKDEIGGVRKVTLDGKTVELAAIDQDIVEDYASLVVSGKPVEQLRDAPRFRDLIAKVAWLYEAYGETEGIGTSYSYPWLLFLLSGHTVAEAQALAREAIESNLGAAIEKVTWRGPRDLETKAGPLDHVFRSGLRVHPEMQDLMASLRRAGIEVFVVSASLKQVVEVFAGNGFGYDVPADHVIGMEVEIDAKSVLRPAYKKDWPQTYKQGKVEAIHRKIGRDPILVAGDSDGDVQMLSTLPGTKLGLILNRAKKGAIGELCKKAVEQKDASEPRYIIQGRNENTGLFIPSEESILFGEKTPRLLAR